VEKAYCVYILASRIGGTLCIGVTNDLVRRTYQHRMGLADGFTKEYAVRDHPRAASSRSICASLTCT
jgi:putative endonuclease